MNRFLITFNRHHLRVQLNLEKLNGFIYLAYNLSKKKKTKKLTQVNVSWVNKLKKVNKLAKANEVKVSFGREVYIKFT